jgi:hypothetical protein
MRVLVFVVASLLALQVAALPRDAQVRADFKKASPCPSTGKSRGACPGYHIDHKVALMNGGRDDTSNMQWLAEGAHRQKTKADFADCKASYTCKHKRAKKRLPWEPQKKAKRKKLKRD